MALSPGTRLGSYEIVEKIGAGGMGEVYRGRDTKLERDVAVKVLPEELARDRERLERFGREARLLAQLNHANIATLHGFEESDGQSFLVMELVGGETLAERIAQSALPLDEAIPVFKQIAEGLESAHEKGILHRDLKPANMKIGPEGDVKILDFGLAKVFHDEPEHLSDSSRSPTLTKGTALGAIMGTASYMSPEQARGKRVDKRSDVWAFGCCLYEALTGKKAFERETVTDTLAAVVGADPDWSALPKTTPAQIRELLARCLRRDVRQRLQHIGDARIAIEEASHAPAAVKPSPAADRTARSWWIAAVAAVVASGITWFATRSNVERRVTRSVLPITLELRQLGSDTPSVAITPDGRHVGYVAWRDGTSEIRLRSLDSLESRVIPDSEEGQMPFFSPDSQWLGFRVRGHLEKVPVSGGAPTTIAPGVGRGASWGDDGSIVFTISGNSGLSRISAEGGEAESLTIADIEKREKSHRLVEVLPGSRAALFTFGTGDIETWDDASIAALSLESGEHTILIEGGTNPRYVSSGHLLYARDGSILAVPFDVSALEVKGTPVTVVEDVATSPIYGHAEFAVSRNGTLVYAPGGSWGEHYRVVWARRDGSLEPIVETPRAYAEAMLSPDESSLAVVLEGANPSIWIHDLARGTMTRLAAGFDNDWAHWTPDGHRISFRSSRAGTDDLYWQPADGSGPAELLVGGENTAWSSTWTPDGRFIVFVEIGPDTGGDIWTLSRDESRERKLVVGTNAFEVNPAISPDGRWIAFQSNESGRHEIYLQRFPDATGKEQVSVQGGVVPRWSNDGRELFYWQGNMLMAVGVGTSGGPSLGQPKPLFSGSFISYDVAKDGRFVLIEEIPTEPPGQVVLVQNWFSELERLVPTN